MDHGRQNTFWSYSLHVFPVLSLPLPLPSPSRLLFSDQLSHVFFLIPPPRSTLVLFPLSLIVRNEHIVHITLSFLFPLSSLPPLSSLSIFHRHWPNGKKKRKAAVFLFFLLLLFLFLPSSSSSLFFPRSLRLSRKKGGSKNQRDPNKRNRAIKKIKEMQKSITKML